MDWDRILQPAILAMAIPILGLVYVIVLAITKHFERMALIEKGIHPDSVKKPEKD